MADAKEPKHATAKSTCSRRRRSHSGSRLAGAGAGLSTRAPPPRISTERSWARPASRAPPRLACPAGAAAAAPRYSRPRPSFKHGQDHERPHQIELLLDRQRPRVQQRRRLGAQGEVGDAAVDGVPVRDVEDGRDGVAEDVRGLEQRGTTAMTMPMTVTNRNSAGSSRRARPAQKRRRRMVPSRPFLHQQRRDEEARQDEEGVDAVEAARHRVQPGVEGDDGQHRERADAVEPRDVPKTRPGRACVSVRAHAWPQPTAGTPFSSSIPPCRNARARLASLPRPGLATARGPAG